MDIRALKNEEEYIESSKVESVAFDLGLDFSKNQVHTNYQNRHAVFQDGKIVACLDCFSFRASLNGKEIGMLGIGGVATLPEDRRSGYIRELFRSVLNKSYEKGDTISYLYPFSNVYYRQFGYESCMLRNNTTIPISSFKTLRINGSIKMYNANEYMVPIREIYRKFALDKNYMILRSDESWEKRLNGDPYRKNRYIYIRYNAEQQADGYVILKPNQPNLVVEEMAYLNCDALKGLLGFFYSFSGRYDFLQYNAPEFINFHLLIPEPFDVKSEGGSFGMCRIVDARRALETLHPPQGREIAVCVKDDFLDWNNDTFLLGYRNGEVKVERTGKEPDMICNICTLAQLLSGYVSLEECLELGSVVQKGKSDALFQTFRKGIPCIYDEF